MRRARWFECPSEPQSNVIITVRALAQLQRGEVGPEDSGGDSGGGSGGDSGGGSMLIIG